MALGSLGLSLCCGILGIGFVALLLAQHAFVEEALNTLVRLLMYLQCSLGLLPELIGALNLFLAGSLLGHLAHGRSSLLDGTGLSTFCTHLRGIQYGQGVTDMHIVALVLTNLQYTSRHLAGYAVFRHIHLPLDKLGFVAQREEAYDGHYYHCRRKAKQGQQYVSVLCFLAHITNINAQLTIQNAHAAT